MTERDHAGTLTWINCCVGSGHVSADPRNSRSRYGRAGAEDTVDEAVISLSRAISGAAGEVEAILVSPPAYLDLLPIAVYACEATGRVRWFNRRAAELWGRAPRIRGDTERVCGSYKLYRLDGKPIRRDECPMAITLKEDRAVRGKEAIAERPDGTRVPFLPYPTPLHDASGILIGAVNMLVDISQRKEAESQQRLLLAELNHRIKNNMQMLQSLLNAARRETSSADARAALSDAAQRVGAMAAVQKVLYQTNNASRYQAKEFIGAVCSSARQGFGKDITIECAADDGELSNDTAVPSALIVNELVTNAAKHGVNGRGEGSIKVCLMKEADCFVLQVEDDGPGFELAET